MRPMWKTILGGVTAAGLMGGTALAQQVILVPGPDGQVGQMSQTDAPGEQRFILVPAPRFAPDSEASGGDAAMALELYRRGYRQGVSDAERAGASRQHFDPAAIEHIGREIFERGYVLGMMQAQFQSAQQAAARQVQERGQNAQQNAGQQSAGHAGDQQSRADQPQTGQTPADQQTAQATEQGGQAAGQQGGEPLVATGVGATAETDVPEATIRAEDSQQHGQHLVDANGRAVYMFTADKQAQGDAQKAASACRDDCAKAWPPVLTRSTPVNAGDAVNSELLGTVERQDGTKQVTYDGWPLYYYTKDQGSDQATGQDVHGFGGEWYLLTPEGKKVGEG